VRQCSLVTKTSTGGRKEDGERAAREPRDPDFDKAESSSFLPPPVKALQLTR
jgi:hypothetical protein